MAAPWRCPSSGSRPCAQEALDTAAQSNRLAEQYEQQQQRFAQLYEQQSEILTSTRSQLGTYMVRCSCPRRGMHARAPVPLQAVCSLGGCCLSTGLLQSSRTASIAPHTAFN